MRRLLAVGLATILAAGLAEAQQVKPGKGGQGGSGAMRESGGNRTPGENRLSKGDGQQGNRQGGQQQQQQDSSKQ